MLVKITSPLPPPRELPGVILNIKEAYRLWIPLHRDFPKVERLSLGQRIDASFLNTLSTAYRAAYLPPQEKIVMLSQTISHIDMVRFFMQMAWENKLIHTEQYSMLVSKLEKIGRQLGGWKKGLQSPSNRLGINKTPTGKAGERQ